VRVFDFTETLPDAVTRGLIVVLPWYGAVFDAIFLIVTLVGGVFAAATATVRTGVACAVVATTAEPDTRRPPTRAVASRERSERRETPGAVGTTGSTTG